MSEQQKMSAKEFQQMMRNTSIVQDKKGRLKSNELSQSLQKILEKEEEKTLPNGTKYKDIGNMTYIVEPIYEIKQPNVFFISGNVPSLKNSKRWTGKFLISSKVVLAYKKAHEMEYLTIKQDMINTLRIREKPYKISFKFIRGSKHRFDFVNIVQCPLDMMVQLGILDDDNADEVIPIFEKYEYNKNNPGMYITIL